MILESSALWIQKHSKLDFTEKRNRSRKAVKNNSSNNKKTSEQKMKNRILSTSFSHYFPNFLFLLWAGHILVLIIKRYSYSMTFIVYVPWLVFYTQPKCLPPPLCISKARNRQINSWLPRLLDCDNRKWSTSSVLVCSNVTGASWERLQRTAVVGR